MNTLSIFGTRPEGITMGSLVMVRAWEKGIFDQSFDFREMRMSFIGSWGRLAAARIRVPRDPGHPRQADVADIQRRPNP